MPSLKEVWVSLEMSKRASKWQEKAGSSAVQLRREDRREETHCRCVADLSRDEGNKYWQVQMGVVGGRKIQNMDGPTGRGPGADTPLRNYRMGKTLGHGSFGKVKIAEHLPTGYKVAIKILNRRKMKSPDMEEKVRREIKICRLFVHPHIIRLYEVIETPTDIYVVMEYVKSGELFDYIVEKGKLQEDEARSFFQQIISGVEYCHRNMVVHRDLKPENLLLHSRGNVKIADFGLSNVMRDGHFLKTSCGSPNYAAPEVVSGKLYAGPEIDVWSCGVILYALLCGTLPFDDENIPNLFKKIKGGVYTLPSHLSLGARDLIPRMLVVDPMKRITIPEIRQHFWFKTRLPRYLAVQPPDPLQLIKKACMFLSGRWGLQNLAMKLEVGNFDLDSYSESEIDEEVLQDVLKKGIDKNHLVESLQNRIQNDATVAYYLLVDSRSPVSSGYLGAEFQEDSGSAGIHPDTSLNLAVGHILQDSGLRPQLPTERKWILGLQSPAPPREIMTQVLLALQAMNVCWKKIGHYNIKCRWFHVFHNPEGMNNHHSPDSDYITDESAIIHDDFRAQSVVKFEMQSRTGLWKKMGDSTRKIDVEKLIVFGDDLVGCLKEEKDIKNMTQHLELSKALQSHCDADSKAVHNLFIIRFKLYKTREENYLLDLQRVSGQAFLFLDLCAAFLMQLGVLN
ncbi:hypothetical protein RHMOL_Rhmol08G0206100 [Rhododendron molle]|uniref:Uncharacterized protein n=1 Tax=Rhododendron molle TaxID=49168 RepID=A0ACC0MQH1_RHOML|nr:hypothetical protein RHMOL_Rhmol08G0206100 [Rhododendron molle]